MTDWKAPEGGPVLGVGLHTFLRDDDAISLLEWREFRSARSERPIGSHPDLRTAREDGTALMARIDPQHALKASLLDRLIDPESDGTASQPGCTVEQMIDSVRRDLEDLLNTHRTVPDVSAEFPEVRQLDPHLRPARPAPRTSPRRSTSAAESASGSSRPSPGSSPGSGTSAPR